MSLLEGHTLRCTNCVNILQAAEPQASLPAHRKSNSHCIIFTTLTITLTCSYKGATQIQHTLVFSQAVSDALERQMVCFPVKPAGKMGTEKNEFENDSVSSQTCQQGASNREVLVLAA